MELLHKRTYNAKHIDNGDGTFRMEAHAGHIHYKDENGGFLDSDLVPVDMGAYWEMTKHSYHLRVAKDFADPLLMQYQNFYEGANHTITYEPHSIAWYNSDTDNVQIFRSQQAVQGEYRPSTNSFYYTNAFGNGIDFEISILRSGFKKEVVIPTKPASFPTAPTVNHSMVALFKYGGTGLTVLKDTQEAWDNDSHMESEGGYQLAEVNPLYKSFIRPAYGIDADGNERSLKVMWRKRNNQLWQIKEIPLKAMENANFPVRFDTLVSYYAGAGDGRVSGQNATWSTVRNETSGSTGSSHTTTTTFVLADLTGGLYRIWRLFFPIDTSGLDDAANITAADFKVTLNANSASSPTVSAVLVQTTQASNTALAAADFDTCGTIDTPTEGASRITMSNATAGDVFTFSLNGTGLGWINKTGFTKLGIRDAMDVDNSAPTIEGTNVALRMSEYSGTSSDPIIDITYTLGGDNTTNFFFLY
jgi:hypothetical protein